VPALLSANRQQGAPANEWASSIHSSCDCPAAAELGGTRHAARLGGWAWHETPRYGELSQWMIHSSCDLPAAAVRGTLHTLSCAWRTIGYLRARQTAKHGTCGTLNGRLAGQCVRVKYLSPLTYRRRSRGRTADGSKAVCKWLSYVRSEIKPTNVDRHHFRPNRKQKYGVYTAIGLVQSDILYDRDTPYRPMGHRLDARKLLPASDKPEVLISYVGPSPTRP